MLTLEQILDDVLIARIQAGDGSAAERLVARYQPPLRYFLIRLLGPGESPDDMLQEVWLSVFRQIRRLKTRESFSVWLYRIARNRAYDSLRRRRRFEALPDDRTESRDGDDEFTAEDAAAVHQGLDALSHEHREVLLLRFLEEMSYEDIAAVTGCTLGTVKSRIHYAKLLLRREMEASNA